MVNYILNLVNIIMGHTLATWMAKTSCQILLTEAVVQIFRLHCCH